MEPGDLWLNVAQMKALADGEWYPFFGMTMKRIGAPFGPVYYSVDFPLLEQLQYIIIKIISFFTKSPFLLLNLYYIFTFIMAAWTAIFACRSFRISRGISLVIGVLFALLPYHFFRYRHIMLAAYYLVPLAGIVVLRQWSMKPLFAINRQAVSLWSKLDRKSWFAVVVCVLVGWWHVYYAFFFCLFMATAGISAAVYRKSWKHLWATGIAIAITAFSLSLTTIPTFYGQSLHGKNPAPLHRYSFESEIYGLKLTNLIMPTMNTLSVLRKVNEKYKSGTVPAEGVNEYLGIVALLGLFCSLASVMLIRAQPSIFIKTGILNFIGVFYGMIGGLSALFSLVTPMWRCPNRISPFLAFWSLLLVAFILQKMKNRMASQRMLFSGLLLILCIWGVLDQTWGLQFAPLGDKLASDRKFIQAIEQTVKPGTVLQLPVVDAPEDNATNEMQVFDHLRGYLFSEKLSWSYGAMRGRENSGKIEALGRFPLNLEKLKAVGIVGIYIDRFGYHNRICPEEARLLALLPIKPIESEDKRFVFFQL
jgi:phosphoglycerol transferase